MMHMMHNLFDHFVPFLLGKSIDLMEEETAPDAVERLFSHYNMEKKKVLLNDILQQGRVKRNTQFSRFIYQINVLASPLLKTFLVTESTQPKAKFFPSSRIHHCFRAKTQPFQRSRIRYSRKHIATFIQQKTAFRRKIVLSHKLLHQHGLKILGFVVIAACERKHHTQHISLHENENEREMNGRTITASCTSDNQNRLHFWTVSLPS